MADIPSMPVISPTSSAPATPASVSPSASSGSLLKGGISEAATEALPIDPAVKAKSGHPGASYKGIVSSGNSGLVADASGRYGEYKSADIRSSRPQPQQSETKNSGDLSQTGGGQAADNDRGAGRAFNEAAAKIKKAEEEKLAAQAKSNSAELLAQKADLERRIDAGDKSDHTRSQKAKIDKALNLPEGHVGRH